MKLEHQYRNECDILRLLVDELELTCERYSKEHKEEINSIEAHDAFEYYAPRCISNLKELLTSSLLVQIQGLLDFSLPKIVEHLAKNKSLTVTPFDKTWKRGSVLCWVKHVLKKEIHSDFDFNGGPYSRLGIFYKIRNEQVHHGGYLSAEQKKINANNLKGVRISEYTDLYDIDFSYCRSVIDDVEGFLIEVEKNISKE
jgi:hypothetical protein